MTASYATCHTTWIEMLLKELKIIEPNEIKLFIYNKLTIDMENHHMCHGQSKHIKEEICGLS